MSLKNREILAEYNPWWGGEGQGFEALPAFRREAFADLYDDVRRLPQIVSVTGPRRVGKSTLLRQIIRQLIQDEGAAQAERIVYFSMDDPALHLPGFDQNRFFNELVADSARLAKAGPVYLFLDEIHRFARWELYLKKFYDLRTPVRFVLSGSASTPIFKKSRESLLGRLKSHHLLPFSFREWHYLQSAERARALGVDAGSLGPDAAEKMGQVGHKLRTMLSATDLVGFLDGLRGRWLAQDDEFGFERYCYEGGFPEVWNLPTPLAKQEYLYQNQVERVIFEDLLLAAEFRKPEMLRRFYLGLLADPGRETNLSKLASQIELSARTIESYFPLLEATDLVWRLHKFTASRASAKAGNFKTYLVDLAVRNAVLKLNEKALLADERTLGHYAENIVANHVRRWPGLVELGYYRERSEELDFVIDLGAERIGVEVKYRNTLEDSAIRGALRVAAKVRCDALIVVTKRPVAEEALAAARRNAALPVSALPIENFLLLF